MDILVLVATLGRVDDNEIPVGITPDRSYLRGTVGAQRAKAGKSTLGEEIAELIGKRSGHHVLRTEGP